MSTRIITTVYLSANGGKCIAQILEVADGVRDCVELEGVDRISGTPVTVRICR
jgi:hypothetical protein